MNLIEILKGVWNKMISPKTIQNTLHITPTISAPMKDAIQLWEDMYKNRSPWLNENIISLGLPALIASEKARTATIEMEIKVTGDNERAEYIRTQFGKVTNTIRKELEYGIALGGFVIKPYPVLGVDNKYRLEFSYTKANNFYPLSFSPEGKITEAAFVDRIVTKDTIFSKLEYHKLEGTTLTVINTAYKSMNTDGQSYYDNVDTLGTPIALTDVPAWSSITPTVVIENIDTLLFAYFKMPQANNIDLNSPLGVSGFSRAIDLIRNADEQYSNLLWEFQGGQLAVDVDRTALNSFKDSKGRVHEVLPKLQDRLFRRNLDLGEDNTYNVFSPQLRDSNIINGLNTILMHIEDSCDLSRGTLSEVTYSEARTATELKILKQRSFAANQDIQKELQCTLECVFNIMDKYCDLYNIVPDGDFEVAYKWDDSIIVDKDAERQVDLIDVNNGLLSKVEYRMKWMGETEEQAREALRRIADEKIAAVTIQQAGLAQSANTQNNTSAGDSESDNNQDNNSKEETKDEEQSRKERAIESNETTE